MTGHPYHALALDWCAQHVGEREEPPGSNRGRFVQSCQAQTWLGGSGWPWCAAFCVASVVLGAGLDYPDRTAVAYDLLNRARKRGWARGRGVEEREDVIHGDFAVFNLGSGHCAVVVEVRRFEVITIDGNSSDMVRRVARPLWQVRGFVHWPEELHPSVPVAERSKLRHLPSRRPLAQVVGGESGRRKLVTRRGRVVRLPAARDKVT